MNFKLSNFILAVAFSVNANANPDNEEPLFECSLPPLHLGVYVDEKHEHYTTEKVRIEKNGEVQFSKSLEDYQGSGNCRYSIWSFEFNEAVYSVETIGCNHPSVVVPENAKGIIRVHDQDFWCY